MLPREDRCPRAKQPEAPRDLAGRVKPRLFSRRPHFVETDLRAERAVEGKHHTQLLSDVGLRERIGSVPVGDMVEHPCLIHGLEAFDRLSKHLLELKYHLPWSGLPGRRLPRLLRHARERHGDEGTRRCGEKGLRLWRTLTGTLRKIPQAPGLGRLIILLAGI